MQFHEAICTYCSLILVPFYFTNNWRYTVAGGSGVQKKNDTDHANKCRSLNSIRKLIRDGSFINFLYSIIVHSCAVSPNRSEIKLFNYIRWFHDEGVWFEEKKHDRYPGIPLSHPCWHVACVCVQLKVDLDWSELNYAWKHQGHQPAT